MRKHTTCIVPDCRNRGQTIKGVEYFTKGYCKAHYLRLLRHGDIQTNKAPKGEARKNNPLYNRYLGMISRCYKESDHRYHLYGGRGIKVCDRWLEPNGQGFRNYCTDVLPSFSDGLELDRIDNDGDYEPGNVRWVTRGQQMYNLQNTKYLTKGGVVKPLAEWSDELGISRKLIWGRILRGWSDEDSLMPIGYRRSRHHLNR